MTARAWYLGLCVAGTVLPYWQLLQFLGEYGLDLRALAGQAFANGVAGAFTLDVLVSSVVLWVLVFVEGRRVGMRHLWAPVAANFAVGVSLGLPLFLYMREGHLAQSQSRVRRAGP